MQNNQEDYNQHRAEYDCHITNHVKRHCKIPIKSSRSVVFNIIPHPNGKKYYINYVTRTEGDRGSTYNISKH